MKQMTPLRRGLAVLILSVLPASLAPAMASASCSTQAGQLKAQKTAALNMQAERDELVISVEDAGDVWEELEATRLFSPDHAVAADAAKADYDSLRDELVELEGELQVKVTALNDGVASYNRTCATKH